MNRRQLLKNITLSLGSTVISTQVFSKLNNNTYTYSIPGNPLHEPLKKPITAVTMGAGSRGNVYGNYGLVFPDMVKIIGVAEPIKIRNERYAKLHNIEDKNRFTTWEDVLKRPKFADAVLITMPDHLHYEPCMKALEAGYDILLEKPMAQTAQQCMDILNMTRKTGKMVAVCHILRYAPYFIKMRELIQKGAIGDVISVQHLEPIEHIHMSHSYVRGNWHNSKQTTPIILAKSCHDLDIIKWLINKKCEKISAMGSLSWFKKENAPAGSTHRCTDGCKVERDCPYSAIKVYAEDQFWAGIVMDFPENAKTKEARRPFILEQIKKSNYGRCVYKMDNDQPDHYITNILFEGNITASFSMEAHTSYHDRRTRIMGSMGDMVGDMTELLVHDFKTGKETKFIPIAENVVEEYKNAGHGGGDWVLMKDFCQAVPQQNPALMTSSVEASIESHIMGFMAEESRKNFKVLDVNI